MSTTEKRRNINEARQDVYNETITREIMAVLAPSGFQTVNKSMGKATAPVEIAIRDRITKKDCMDIAYGVLLKIARVKIEMLKSISRESTAIKNEMSGIEKKLQKIEQDVPRAFRLVTQHRELTRDMVKLKIKLDAYSDNRLLLLSIGPVVPDEIMKKENL